MSQVDETRSNVDPWKRHERKTVKMRPEQADKPLSQRLTEFRGGGQAEDANATASPWKRHEARQAIAKPASVEQPVSEKAQFNAETDRQRRELGIGAKKAAAAIAAPEVAPEDIQAILQAFIVRHEQIGDFYANEFNAGNLLKCVEWQIKSGVSGFAWNTRSLESVHTFLGENGYYELEPKGRKRALNKIGEAARVWPQWVEPAHIEPATRQLSDAERIDRVQEVAAARKVPFDKLKETVRQQFKSDSTTR